jgi:hypothetical protein
MSARPELDSKISLQDFRSHYWLNAELSLFCRQEGLQTSGGKETLTRRISHYLETGEKLTEKQSPKRVASDDCGEITEDSIIEDNYVCSENRRAYYENVLGTGFGFSVAFQKWLKGNVGKSYGDAIRAYRQIEAEKKNVKTEIGKQFEYNAYIRAFFEDNSGRTLDDAIKCWKWRKSVQGASHKYERADLAVLHGESKCAKNYARHSVM